MSTPNTPWKLTGMGKLVDAAGNLITLPPLDEGSTQSDWDALETVVLCVNSHDKLREALQAITDECPHPKLPYGVRVVEIARAALKESEAK